MMMSLCHGVGYLAGKCVAGKFLLRPWLGSSTVQPELLENAFIYSVSAGPIWPDYSVKFCFWFGPKVERVLNKSKKQRQ